VNDWQLVHSYRRAVEEDRVPPILCPDDDTELVSVMGKNEEPALKCFSCDNVYTPGVAVFDMMRKNLEEIKWNS